MQGKKRVCCIIGGTSGIGNAIAKGFVKNGDIVIVSGRDKTKLRKAFLELNKAGNQTDIQKICDVRNKTSVEALLKIIVKKHKCVDVLVVAAGVHRKKSALLMSEKEWKEVIDINLTGTFIADKVFGSFMCRKKSGAIINVGSLASFVALSDVSAYSASKGGVVMLTKSLAVEWAKYNVRVNAIIPGVIPTELNKKALKDRKRRKNILERTPLKRFGRVDETVSTAIFLASPQSSFITGACVPVDGGFLAWAGF